MNRSRCERAWQAEAGADGRLEPKDLASFERHAANCQDCSIEVAKLGQITERMKHLPDPERTDLEHRRARSELLRKANEQLVSIRHDRSRWPKVALTTALVAGLSVMAMQYSTSERSSSSPRFDIADVSHAVWHVETDASTSRVKLQSGTASFHVERLQKDARFFVDMPDGRIEVRGTRFIVDVVDGKTRSVEVLEGTVLLEVAGFQSLLQAPARWPESMAAEAIQKETTRQEGSGTPTAKSAEVEVDVAPSAAVPALKNPAASAPTPALSAIAIDWSAPVPAPKDEAGPRFAEAMQAFTGGNDAQADQLFAAFIRDFPRDGRAEDAMFLRAKSKARRGDMAGAAAVARQYLRTFPKGFRRPEAERLAGAAP